MKKLVEKYGGRRFVKTAVAGSAVLASVSPVAFATGEGTTETATITSLITSNWPDFVALFGNIWSLMTANPLLAFLTTVGIAAAGFRVFRMARRAARR